MNLLSKEQMEKLTTQRLLVYKKSLMSVPETSESPTKITKDSPEWQAVYKSLKDILNTREHIDK
jgi:hypothetical protein